MPKRQLLLALLFLAARIIYAQNTDQFPGYCITASGDSIAGTLYVGEIWQGVIRIQKTGQQDWTPFKPQEIRRAVRDNGFAIYPQQLAQGPDTLQLFIQQFLSGGYNLYEGRWKKLTSVFYLSSKDKPNLVRVNSLALETQFKAYFGDCAKKSKLKPFYEKERLARFVKEMNECAYGSKIKDAEVPKTKTTFIAGVHGAASFLLPPVFPEGILLLDEARFRSSVRPSFGVSGCLNIGPTFGITIGAKYADQSFKSDSLSNDFFKGYPVGTQTFNAHYFYRYQLDVRSHYLEIPIGLRITPRAYQKQTVVVSGGAAFTFPLSVKFKSSWGTPYQVINNFGLNPPRTVEDGYFPVDKVESKIPNIAVFAGFGFRRLLDNKNQLEYGLQYTWSRDKMTAHLGGVYAGRQEDLMHTRHRIQLMLSYYFQL